MILLEPGFGTGSCLFSGFKRRFMIKSKVHLICTFGSNFWLFLAAPRDSNPVLMDGNSNYIPSLDTFLSCFDWSLKRLSKSLLYKCSTIINFTPLVSKTDPMLHVDQRTAQQLGFYRFKVHTIFVIIKFLETFQPTVHNPSYSKFILKLKFSSPMVLETG